MMGSKSARYCLLTGLTLFFVLFASSILHAKTRYVDKWGDDANAPDCVKGAPCLTIQQAIDSSHKNDTIIVGPGRFIENLTINVNAIDSTSLEGLKLRSTAGRHSTIVLAANASIPVLNIYQAKVQVGKKGQGFTFYGATGSGIGIAGIYISVSAENASIKIEGNRLGKPRRTTDIAGTGFANDFGIYVSTVGKKLQIRHNIFQNNRTTGLYCFGCDQALIRDNRFESNHASGLIIQSSERVVIDRNISSANAGAGFGYTGPDIGLVKIINNVSEFNGGVGLGFSGDGGLIDANIATANDLSGLEIEKGALPFPMQIRKNLAVGNGLVAFSDGLRLLRVENVKVENNTAVNNTDDGIDIIDTISLSTLKKINAIDNVFCGMEGDSGQSYFPTSYFGASNNLHTCVANFNLPLSAPAKPGPLYVNKARAVVGG